MSLSPEQQADYESWIDRLAECDALEVMFLESEGEDLEEADETRTGAGTNGGFRGGSPKVDAMTRLHNIGEERAHGRNRRAYAIDERRRLKGFNRVVRAHHLIQQPPHT